MVITTIKKFRWAIYLLFVTIFAWVAAGIGSSVMEYVLYKIPTPKEKATNLILNQKAESKDYASYEVIQERNIFDVEIERKAGSSKGNEIIVSETPRSLIGLTLKGTIAGPKWLARAIIDVDGKQRLYKIGDTIQDAKLKKIERNKIVIERAGVQQTILLEVTPSSGEKTSSRYTPSQSSPLGSRTDKPKTYSDAPTYNDIMSGMQPYMGGTRVSPYYKAGKPYGFRAGRVDQSSLAYELGARSGDVVKSVNNMPLMTREDVEKAYQTLKGESSVEVEVERQGKTLRFTVPVQKIVKEKGKIK